jgi:large subunit ribosomal protein L10
VDKVSKQAQIEVLRDIFANVESMVLTEIEGLNASEVVKLRKDMHESKVSFKVFKNTLAHIAAKESAAASIADDFVGSIAIAWSAEDAILPAKVAFKFKENIEKFKIKVGYNAGKRLGLAELEALSKLPGLSELKSQLLGVMQAVPAKLLAQINAPASHLLSVIQAKIDKDKEQTKE